VRYKPPFDTPAPYGNSVTYERKGVVSEVVIPLLNCLIFGVGITLALLIVQWGFFDIPPRPALAFAGGVGVLAASLATTWRFYKAIVWFAEEAARRDLDRDGWVGQPEDEPRIITVRAAPTSTIEDKREKLRQEMASFIRGCAVDTSMRRWEHQIGREKYLIFRQVLMDAGHAAWTNDDRRQGWELTTPAEDIIASFN